MKILYVGNEQQAAGLAARALHGTLQNVTVAWAQAPLSALDWLRENRDTAAIIVEVQAQSCASFVDQVRAVGPSIPLVVIAGSAPLEVALETLNAGADGYLVAGPSLEADLRRVVPAVIGRAQTRGERLTRATSELEAARDRAEQQFARAEEARHETERRSATELAAAAARFTELQAQHTASRTRDGRISIALQERLLELERTQRSADDRRASDVAALADQLAKRHAEFTAALTHRTQSCDALTAKLNDATLALSESQQARSADAAAAAEHLRRRETELGASLAEAAARGAALEAALAEAEAVHRDVRQRADADRASANERQASLEELLVKDANARTHLQQKLAAAEAAYQEAHDRHAAELARTTAQLAGVQVRYETALEEHAQERAAFERRSTDADSAVEEARRAAVASAEQLVRREAELGGQLAEAGAGHAALEKALAEAQAVHHDAVQRAESEGDRAKSLEQQLLAAENARRDADREHAAELEALERELASARADAARGRHRLLHVVSAHRRRGHEQKTQLEARISGERAEADRSRRDMQSQLEQLQQEREQLWQLLSSTQDQVQQLHATLDDERQTHEHARLASDAEVQRLSAESSHIRQSFDGLQAAFQTLERSAGEQAAERARLEILAADRESELTSQADRHRIAEQAAQDAVTQLEARLRQEQETGRTDVGRLQRDIDALRRDLDVARTDAEARRRVAERVPDLQAELELSRRERRRDFERAPYGLCRCTNAGVITDANHTFVTLLGRRRADELTHMDFAAAVFTCAGDLSWLIERARTTRKTEAVETEWKSRDGRLLVVRLHVFAATTGSIEIAVEDITDVRSLEERLRRAQRMEAVGRLASEVAVTCDAILRDIIRDANESLTAIGQDAALRRQGGRLVTDATRASSLLRQLAVYGDQQVRAVEPVSARRVLQDLAPVLKRVVGGEIELALSKSSGSFDVDVEAERLERVLVNVAGYARQRMPEGGQMKIDLATTAVGRQFVASHPHVRAGDHVLITVTELPGASPLRSTERASDTVDKPAVDLSALVELVGTCGGHLWMEAQPAGNMVVKIHLPKRMAIAATDTQREGARADRGGRLARWFR